MPTYIFVIECVLFVWKPTCAGIVLLLLYTSICIAVGDPVVQSGGLGSN